GDTEQLREYEVEEDVTIWAVFKKSGPEEKVAVYIVQALGGTVEVELEDGTVVHSGDSVGEGATLWMLADAEEDYIFVSWWDGNTEELREYKVEEEVTISAIFKLKAGPEPEPDSENFVVWIESPLGGTVQVSNGPSPVFSGDTLPIGTTLTLRAIPDAGYRLTAWWDGNTDKLRSYVLDGYVTVSATFSKTVGLETERENLLRLYPNPSDGHIVLEAGIAARIEVFSPQGVRLRAFELGEGERYDLDLSGQPSGVYYARLSGQGKTSVFKILLR
ncbi:MAG: T9SS type A sorting domain-containing protein, partial [Bacteroidales bacterium]|nr:T9SS type A sorting domain-containing protein [Bacteroidales bacterium]